MYIEYQSLKILLRKIIKPFPKTPLYRKPLLNELFYPVRTRFGLEEFHCNFDLKEYVFAPLICFERGCRADDFERKCV